MAENKQPWIRAAVRYWGGAMSLVDDTGQSWPGFRYTPAEKQLLTTLAEEAGGGEVGLFLLLNSLIFIALAGAVIWAGMIPLIKALYPVPQDTSALVVFVILGIICAIMAGIGLPLSIVLSAGLLGKIYRHPDKPELAPAEIAQLFQKVQWQCLRCGLLVTTVGLLGAAAMSIYEGRATVFLQTVLRCVVPALSISMLAYFLGKRAVRGG